MGCTGGRVSLAGCANWCELSEKAKVYDDNVKKELENATKADPKTKEDEEKITFYGAWTSWEAARVQGKEFDSNVCKLADAYYATLDSKLDSAAKTDMQKAYVELDDGIGKLKDAPKKEDPPKDEAPKEQNAS